MTRKLPSSLRPDGSPDLTGRGRRWATTFETADYIGCGESTVRRMIATGLLPAYRVNARLVRIDLNEADDAIGARCLPSGATAVRGAS